MIEPYIEVETDDGALTVRWVLDDATAVALTVHAGTAILLRAGLDEKFQATAEVVPLDKMTAFRVFGLISSASEAAKEDKR